MPNEKKKPVKESEPTNEEIEAAYEVLEEGSDQPTPEGSETDDGQPPPEVEEPEYKMKQTEEPEEFKPVEKKTAKKKIKITPKIKKCPSCNSEMEKTNLNVNGDPVYRCKSESCGRTFVDD